MATSPKYVEHDFVIGDELDWPSFLANCEKLGMITFLTLKNKYNNHGSIGIAYKDPELAAKHEADPDEFFTFVQPI